MNSDARLLTPRDFGYPNSLGSVFGKLAPPDIWYLGNLGIVETRTVGFCGSRRASAYGLQIAADCASQLSAAGVTVVSGYAPGVDMASHDAALVSKGHTIIVLPVGIDRIRIKKSIASLWDWQRTIVVSQFPRKEIWP